MKSSYEKFFLLEWLGIQRVIPYQNARWLGPIVGVLLFILALMIFVVGCAAIIMMFGGIFGWSSLTQDITGQAMRNYALVVVAIFGAPFLVWRAIVAQKQVDVAEQGQITDRINQAVAGLGAEKIVKTIIETPRYKKGNNDEWLHDDDGNLVPAKRPDGTPIVDREVIEQSEPNLEVRIGSIYALERIASDSLRDHIQIMEILCAYLRENSPAESLEPSENPFDRPWPRTDIQAAITVIGRRSQRQVEREWDKQFRLDLGDTDLSRVDFTDGEFSAAKFFNCRLEAAIFKNSRLRGTLFFGALLNEAIFHNSELRGTRFENAIVNRPYPKPGTMTVSLNFGNIYGISIAGADVSAINYFGESDTMKLIFGSADTILHRDIGYDRDSHRVLVNKIKKLREVGEKESAEDLRERSEFANWSPFDRSDLLSSRFHKDFLDRLGLTGWPYQ